MKSDVVDIIIVNLNGKHYLERCLPSIIKHSKRVSYQLVVVDNGSKDSSIEWLHENFPSAYIIQNSKNIGFSAACNQGIMCSDGKYILLLNNDTEFLNDVISFLVEFMKAKKNAGLLGPLIVFPDGTAQASIKHFPPIWKFILQQLGISLLISKSKKLYYPYGPFRLSDYKDTREVEWLSGACLMFCRSLFQEIGRLDEKMPFGVEDMDYAQRAINKGFKNYFIPEAKVMHYKGGTHIQKSSQEQTEFVRKSYTQGVKIYFRKHHSRMEYLLVRLSLLINKLLKGI